MTVRRCGIQLPSGKDCPTFLGSAQNVCAKHARDRYTYPTRPVPPPLLLPPARRRLTGRLIGWALTRL